MYKETISHLHGIPILLEDNIATSDEMHTKANVEKSEAKTGFAFFMPTRLNASILVL